jgi:hypothetical protein
MQTMEKNFEDVDPSQVAERCPTVVRTCLQSFWRDRMGTRPGDVISLLGGLAAVACAPIGSDMRRFGLRDTGVVSTHPDGGPELEITNEHAYITTLLTWYDEVDALGATAARSANIPKGRDISFDLFNQIVALMVMIGARYDEQTKSGKKRTLKLPQRKYVPLVPPALESMMAQAAAKKPPTSAMGGSGRQHGHSHGGAAGGSSGHGHSHGSGASGGSHGHSHGSGSDHGHSHGGGAAEHVHGPNCSHAHGPSSSSSALSSPSSVSLDKCAVCAKPESSDLTLKKCARCLAVAYCSVGMHLP